MNQAETNGVPRKSPPPIILPDGSYLYRWSDDDEDAVVDTTIRPDRDMAYPPKSDAVPETRDKELLALINAMSAYKRAHAMAYLLWHDVLNVLHDLGYRKTAVSANDPEESAHAQGTQATG